MENTEKNTIEITELVNELNGSEMSKTQVLDKYGITDGKMRRLMKNNGYKYNSKSRKWQLESEILEETEIKVTYRIPQQLHKAVKLQAILEGVSATEIMVKALNDYIPSKTKEIVRENEK